MANEVILNTAQKTGLTGCKDNGIMFHSYRICCQKSFAQRVGSNIDNVLEKNPVNSVGILDLEPLGLRVQHVQGEAYCEYINLTIRQFYHLFITFI